ncbi:MAG TPA: hypothetical protein VHG92_02830 [Afifellaceae bacterium]|nr:hypothetical protein [Afifellaceae bacterium]
MASDSLSAAMLACLEDAFRGPLYRRRHGWANRGDRGHATSVVKALDERGLLHMDRNGGVCGAGRQTNGSAVITVAGLARWDEELQRRLAPKRRRRSAA